MVDRYLRALYLRTMERAYDSAYARIVDACAGAALVLDCGAHTGSTFAELSRRCGLSAKRYRGIEWNPASVAAAQAAGLDVVQGDLNQPLACADRDFDCVYALSVVEHLLNPCRFLRECHRVLKPGGRLVLLTPNISTYFTALQILLGRMPSSGPHPDSDMLLESQQGTRFSVDAHDTESETPVHRHLVVFSYRVLSQYLRMIGFARVEGRAFGWYPLPNFLQPALERLDPWHCHQMVFTATK